MKNSICFYILILFYLTSDLASAAVFTNLDNRIEASQSANPIIQKANRATVVMIDKWYIQELDDQTVQIYRSPTLKKSQNTCKNERFNDQLTPASCTGVLIAADVILTAGHCVQHDECKDHELLFNYEAGESSVDEMHFSSDSIYHCREVIASKYFYSGTRPDYALLRLDRPVKGISPVPLSKKSYFDLILSSEKARFFVISSPSGIPKKLSEDIYPVKSLMKPESLVSLAGRELFSQTKAWGKIPITSAFAWGSSGAPVFDSTDGSLIGIINVIGTSPFRRREIDGKACNESMAFGIDLGIEANASVPQPATTLMQPIELIPELIL